MSEFIDFFNSTGFVAINWKNCLMLLVGLIFIYIAINKNLEPYELLPIGLGVIVANLPLTGLLDSPTTSTGHQESGIFGIFFHYGLSFWNILPPIIFLGIGAMTDFGPIIANPKVINTFKVIGSPK